MQRNLLISSAAALAGVTPHTLRVYETLGLVSPERDSAGRRLYNAADVTKAKAALEERMRRRGCGLRNSGAAA